MYRPINRGLHDIVHTGIRNGIEVKYKLMDFLQSADSDKVVVDMDLMRNFKRLAVLHREMENYILNLEGYEVRIAHCYRSMTTYNRLKEIYDDRKAKGLYASKPSKTSQHFFAEALDCHLYYQGKRIRGIEEAEYVAELIRAHFPDMFLQLFAYEWGVHLSIETERSIAAGIRKKFGVFR